jgi:hypothetical protein
VFAKIDGGGAGRGANDDRRIDLKEWLSGYQKVGNYGFLVLDGMAGSSSSASASDRKALAVFELMDGNGGGVVLLDEFCAFIKTSEMQAGTEMGLLLGADEEGGVGKVDKATKHAAAGGGRVSRIFGW